jgi:hypothetical protein
MSDLPRSSPKPTECDDLPGMIFHHADPALTESILAHAVANLTRDHSEDARRLKEDLRRRYRQTNGLRPFHSKTSNQLFISHARLKVRQDPFLQEVMLVYWARERRHWLELLNGRSPATLLEEVGRDQASLQLGPDGLYELKEEMIEVCRGEGITPEEMALFIRWNGYWMRKHPESKDLLLQPASEILPTPVPDPGGSIELLALLDELRERILQNPPEASEWQPFIDRLRLLLSEAEERQRLDQSAALLRAEVSRFVEEWGSDLSYFEIEYEEWEVAPDGCQADEVSAALRDLALLLDESRQLRSIRPTNRSQERSLSQRMDQIESSMRRSADRIGERLSPRGREARPPRGGRQQAAEECEESEGGDGGNAGSPSEPDRSAFAPPGEGRVVEQVSAGLGRMETSPPAGGDCEQTPTGEPEAVDVEACQEPPATSSEPSPSLDSGDSSVADDAGVFGLRADSGSGPLRSAREAAQGVLAGGQASGWQSLLWSLIAEGDLSRAYWLASALPENGETSPVAPSLIAAIAGARLAVRPSGALEAELLELTPSSQVGAGAGELFTLAACLVPALTMPQALAATGKAGWLSATGHKTLRPLALSIKEFRQKHPSFSLGIDTVAELSEVRSYERLLEDAARQISSFIAESAGRTFSYGGAARVWRHLLTEECELGRALRLAAGNSPSQAGEVTATAHRWRDAGYVEAQLRRVNQEAHHQRHPGEIAGAAARQLREQVARATSLLAEWAGAVAGRQKPRAVPNHLRADLQRLHAQTTLSLPPCLAEIEGLAREAAEADARLAAAAHALKGALSDLAWLFGLDRQPRPDFADGLRGLLNRSLLRLPEVRLLDDGSPERECFQIIPRAIADSVLGRRAAAALRHWAECGRLDLAGRLIEEAEGEGQAADGLKAVIESQRRRAASSLNDLAETLREDISELMSGRLLDEEQGHALLTDAASVTPGLVENFAQARRRLNPVAETLSGLKAGLMEKLKGRWLEIERDLPSLLGHEQAAQVRRTVARKLSACEADPRGHRLRRLADYLAGLRQPPAERDAVEADLEPLLESLNEAVSQRAPVVHLNLWRPVRYAALLPFHLHLKWPDLIESLPLNASFTLLPFVARDELTVHSLPYRVADARRNRAEARVKRCQSRRQGEEDGHLCDWEQALSLDRIGHLRLPGTAFLAVDRVAEDGRLRRGARPVLGQRARGSPRPSLLTAGHRLLAEEDCRTLCGTSLPLVNLQGVRSGQLLENIRRVLRAAKPARPALILASSPADLLKIGADGLPPSARCRAAVPDLRRRSLRVCVVGRDRAASERRFRQAFEEVRGISAELDRAVELARGAWWEMRQRLSDDAEAGGWQYRRFLSAAEQLRRLAPQDARLLEQGRVWLERQSLESGLLRERVEAVVGLLTGPPSATPTVILTRDQASAVALQRDLSARLGLAVEDLASAGIRALPYQTAEAAEEPERLIVAGYFGLRTIDAVQRSQAEEVCFIFDPVECLAAWCGVDKFKQTLSRFGEAAGKAIQALDQIAECLSVHLPCRTSDVEFEFPFLSSGEPHTGCGGREGLRENEVLVLLADGGQLVVSPHSRFSALRFAPSASGRRRAELRQVAAAKLECGDEIVLLRDDLHADFSARMLDAIDAAELKQLASRRRDWAAMVKAFAAGSGMSVRTMRGAMAALGEEVDEATIRPWLKVRDDFTLDEGATFPNSYSRFAAFARVVNLDLPEALLRDYYDGIHRLRVEHRRAGRKLVGVIRDIHLNRLDASSLAKVEHHFGLAVRELTAGARLATVVEVVLPGGSEDEE